MNTYSHKHLLHLFELFSCLLDFSYFLPVKTNNILKNAHVSQKAIDEFHFLIWGDKTYNNTGKIRYDSRYIYNTYYDKLLFVNKALNNRYPGKIATFSNQGVYGILLNTLISSINSVSLGIMEEDLEMAKGLKFTNIVPRIENYRELTTAQVDEIYDLLKKYKVKTVIFAKL